MVGLEQCRGYDVLYCAAAVGVDVWRVFRVRAYADGTCAAPLEVQNC